MRCWRPPRCATSRLNLQHGAWATHYACTRYSANFALVHPIVSIPLLPFPQIDTSAGAPPNPCGRARDYAELVNRVVDRLTGQTRGVQPKWGKGIGWVLRDLGWEGLGTLGVSWDDGRPRATALRGMSRLDPVGGSADPLGGSAIPLGRLRRPLGWLRRPRPRASIAESPQSSGCMAPPRGGAERERGLGHARPEAPTAQRGPSAPRRRCSRRPGGRCTAVGSAGRPLRRGGRR